MILFFIFLKGKQQYYDFTAGLRKAMRNILLPMDILVYTPAEIARDKERKFTFIHDVLKSGKVLYAV